MAGSNEIFNDLFVSLQQAAFFYDALYPLSWIEEIQSGIDRETGVATVTTNTYSANAFLTNPSKSERPAEKIFKGYQAGDVVVLARQDELAKKPPLDSIVTFDGQEYTCKGVVRDPVGVTWKILLRQ